MVEKKSSTSSVSLSIRVSQISDKEVLPISEIENIPLLKAAQLSGIFDL